VIAYLLNITAIVLVLLTFNIAMSVLFESRKSKESVILLHVPVTICALIFVFFVPVPLLVGAILAAPFFFAITLNYDANVLTKLNALGFFYAVLSINSFTVNLFSDISFGVLDSHRNTVNFIIVALLSLLLMVIIHKRFANIKKKPADIPAFRIPLLIGQVLLIVVTIFNAFDLPIFEGLAIVLSWHTFNIFIVYLLNMMVAEFENKVQTTLQAQEKEYYFAQCEIMQESMDKVKSVRHDMKTHLATLKGYATKANATEITNYLDTLLDDIGGSEVYSETGNVVFDSIINYKLKNADSDNIRLDIKMIVPPVLNMDVADVTTILGNLLDNALNAVAKVDKKVIKLDIEFNKCNLYIKVENSFNGHVFYAEQTDELPTSSKNKSGHGYGLKNVKRSLEKYNGHMKISHTYSTFSVVVFLYVE